MSKHTPGPWFMEQRTYDDGSTHFRITASDGHGWADDRYMSVSGCIDKRDALLIAAAPELLEALQSVLDNCLDSEWLCAAHAKARAAIAKATGEQV